MSTVLTNKRATAKQKDPTRTSAIIRMYTAAMRAKILAIQKAIRVSFVDHDVFGFKRGLLLHVALPADKAWSALDLTGKNRAFAAWLDDTIKEYFLEDIGLNADAPPAWLQKFIRAAYSRGVTSALTELSKAHPELSNVLVSALIHTPFHQDRLKQMFDRNFTELKGFSTQMSTELQRILADGLLRGDNPRTMAAEMAARLGISISRAERIARTEVIKAHAEAQLNTFERFGIEDVHLEAEWITAGDDRVCETCDEMAGKIFSIEEAHGMIPIHPQCRCDWLALIPES